MVKTKLVEELIRDGAKLLRELDLHNFPVESMFWLHMPEDDYWRLVIGSPVVAKKGGAAAYRDLDEILHGVKLAGLSLEDISLLNPDSSQFRSLFSQAGSSGRLAAGEAWTEFEDGVVYRWAAAFLSAELGCDASPEQLHKAWDDERKLSNKPALLIDLVGRKLTLRFHPQHGALPGIENMKQDFANALHRQPAFRECKINWLN